MKAVIGLGNPGKKYEKTRHNYGRMAIHHYLKKYSRERIDKIELDFSLVYRIEERLIIEPLTYMNLSGLSLRETVKKYKLASSDCLLVYDEYAIPFGKMRAKPEGSSGGHNGVASAIEALSTREIPRLRLGIGTNAKPDDLANFVLEEFDLDELRALPALVETASAAIDSFFTESFHNLMNRFNK